MYNKLPISIVNWSSSTVNETFSKRSVTMLCTAMAHFISSEMMSAFTSSEMIFRQLSCFKIEFPHHKIRGVWNLPS